MAKLNREIVASIKRWLLDGMTTKQAHARVRALGYKVSVNAIIEINGGRNWATVQPSKVTD